MISSTIQRPLEKVSFKNAAIATTTALALCSGFFSESVTLPKWNNNNSLYNIDSISNVSYSSQDYFSSYAKDYNHLLMKLEKIESLENNWNGYDAEIIPYNAIVKAKNFIFYVKDLSTFISIFPTARQSIQIEFEVDDIYCEVEIFSDVVEIYAEKNGEEYESKRFNSIEQASSNFRNLFNVRVNH